METWLKGRTGSRGSTEGSVGVSGYNIIRNDRMTATSGGGVALYVLKSIKTRIVAKSCGLGIEYLFVECLLNKVKILIGVVYRSPTSEHVNTLEALLSACFIW